MAFWHRKKETRADSEMNKLYDLLLQAGLIEDNVTRENAENIATLKGCIDLISNTVASLPIKLFREVDGKVSELLEDNRVSLLNDNTGDTLDGFQFKKALVEDYFYKGNAYAYINREKGKIASIHYIKDENVSINVNTDPIFKSYDIVVNGDFYQPYDFIKILRNTRDGATGTGIIQSNPILLSVCYNSLKYENILSKTGGNKKGFIEADDKLDADAIALLKDQWKKMYSGNSENCVVLNKGLTFKDSAATPTEMQMNQNKVTNGDEICRILNVPPALLSLGGQANTDDYGRFIKMAILPLLTIIVSALNRDLLFEKEKKSFYFAFDTKELLKGDIEKRYKAYEIGIKNKILKVNEARYEEDREPIEALEDTIVLGLNDVLYNTKKGTVYTPNTDKTSDMNNSSNNSEGGEK